MSLSLDEPKAKVPGTKKPAAKTPAKPVPKPAGHPMSVVEWPKQRMPKGLGLSLKDGWNLGIGLGLAMTVAVPLILIVFSCFIWVALMIFGSALVGILGGLAG